MRQVRMESLNRCKATESYSVLYQILFIRNAFLIWVMIKTSIPVLTLSQYNKVIKKRKNVMGLCRWSR